VTYSYNPNGRWTARHQMTVNGKRDGFTLADLRACAEVGQLRSGLPAEILREVVDAAAGWNGYADQAGVEDSTTAAIGAAFRLTLPTG
jgi:serine/threonine-protein kinase HipA